MVYITGDTQGDYDFGKLIKFSNENPNITINDYVIIAGDFGAVWNLKTLNKDLEPYQNLPFTVLFVDGNHENFDLLNSYPITEWNGGKVHVIRDNIIHLMRGQVYNIENKTFFTFGGGTSIDRDYRIEGISWWKQEMPSYEEFLEGVENLKSVNNTVDYIVTHAAPEKAMYYPALRNMWLTKLCEENKLLSRFEETVNYKHWYFGHYHIDAKVTYNKTAIYNSVIKTI